MTTIRCYSELVKHRTFRERYEYLRLDRKPGYMTFGSDRYLNQSFYHSTVWGQIRDFVITRDMGRDLGAEGHEIYSSILVHHMNPITAKDIVDATDFLLDPEFLICVSPATHNAIHYGDELQLPGEIAERTPFDTCPWKRRGTIGEHTDRR